MVLGLTQNVGWTFLSDKTATGRNVHLPQLRGRNEQREFRHPRTTPELASLGPAYTDQNIPECALVTRQVLIWGLPVDPIFADGAAKLRSRAAPSARIEPQILFLTEH